MQARPLLPLIAAQPPISLPFPGYPLWTLLSHLAMRVLPSALAPSPAGRANLLAALCGAAAAGCVYAAVDEAVAYAPAAVLAAGMYATGPLTWHYALQAEVFALNRHAAGGGGRGGHPAGGERTPTWALSDGEGIVGAKRSLL